MLCHPSLGLTRVALQLRSSLVVLLSLCVASSSRLCWALQLPLDGFGTIVRFLVVPMMSCALALGLCIRTRSNLVLLYTLTTTSLQYTCLSSLAAGAAGDHVVDSASSDLVDNLVRFSFRVRFDGVERVLGAPYSLSPEFMVSHVEKVVNKAILVADSIRLVCDARAELCARLVCDCSATALFRGLCTSFDCCRRLLPVTFY